LSWLLDEEVLAVLAAIIVVSATFAVAQALSIGVVREPFSELGLLGPAGLIGDYPRQVDAGSPFKLNVYIGNHEGKTMYYKVLVKVGDSSSIVNSTTPLQAEPIMELRAVLAHGESKVIPINITLHEPAMNVRIIFEVWAYDEDEGRFTYRGLWNQLWLNVTGEALNVSPVKKAISREVEEALAQGYLSIRRAERAGGNVSTMINLMSRALDLAVEGDYDEAKRLVSQVLAMEDQVSRMGIEAERARLLTIVGSSIIICAACIGGFMFLRHRIWNFWAKLHRDWMVTWIGGDLKLEGIEDSLRHQIKVRKEVTVEELISTQKSKYKPYEVARAICRLVRRGAIGLVDPNPPKSFIAYFTSRYNLGFAIAALLTALCIISVYTSNMLQALAALRIVVGSIFVLFLPGYSLVEALYPRGDELSPLERLALSIGLSLALVPLVGLILNYTPWGIRLDPIMVSLSLLTLGLLFIASVRKYGLLSLREALERG